MSKPKKLRTLIKRAGMGDPRAMYRLGLLYQLGRGYARDVNAAAEWIAAAADLGYAPAAVWMEDYRYDDDACVQANS